MRKAAKAPFDAEADRVQQVFKDPLDKLTVAAGLIKDMNARWLLSEKDRLRKEADARAAEAQAKAEAAALAEAEAAKSNNVEAIVAAETARAVAVEAEAEFYRAAKEKPQAKGDFGGRAVSLRTTTKAKIVDLYKCWNHFRNDPGVMEALQRAANAAVRAGQKDVPGVELDQSQSAA